MGLIRLLSDPNPQARFFGDKALYKSSPKTPAAPDPVKTAAAQTAQNKETAWYNAMLENMDQYTPYGSLTYQNLGTVEAPKWQSTINLSPEQKQLYDTSTRSDLALAGLGEEQLGRIRQAVSSPYSFGALGDAPTADDISTASMRGEEALMSRLNPQFSRDEEALRTRLINQGIGQGSEAYNREMERFNQARNDARTQAIISGASYGGALQDQAMQRRQQGINEYTTQRNAPLNEYIAMTSGTQVQNPQFQSGGNQGVNPVDVAGLINQNYQNQINSYNQKVAGQNSTMGSLFSLGGSFLGAAGQAGGFGALFSDARLKTNIKPIGNAGDIPLYSFKYDANNDYVRHINLPTDKTYIGVMAQDIEKIMPEAVTETDGYKRVNYEMIGVEMREVI